MDKEKAEELIKKYLEDTCSEEERLLVEAWYNEAMDKEADLPVSGDWERIGDRIYNSLPADPAKQTRRLWPRVAAAASIALVFSIGMFWYIREQRIVKAPQVAVLPEQLDPSRKGIVLTLGDGKRLMLDGKQVGRSRVADGTQISQQDGMLSYTSGEGAMEAQHTLSNSGGLKYAVLLSDGTEAFLDAASSITYPVSFKGKERRVSVTGQVYFKVKHNAAMPFRVAVKDEVIEDIGTEFNVNAYDDEPALKTTLVEGAVRVKLNSNELLLKPGEAAVASDAGLTRQVADLEEVTAWLQDKLIFNKEPLEQIMNRVARIYDVKLVWLDNDAKALRFGGSLNKTKKLSVVLNYFRKIGNVDFVVDGKTVKIFKTKTGLKHNQG